MLSPKLRTLFESTQKLIHRGAIQNVRKIVDKTHSADIAVIFRFFDNSARITVFNLLSNQRKAEVLSELELSVALDFLPNLNIEDVANILKLMETDDAANLIDSLPEDYSQKLMELLKPKEAEVVEDLLRYKDSTAGRIMTPDVFSLPESTKTQDAIKALQNAKNVEMAFYLYVVNDQNQLVGVVSLRQLVTVKPNTVLQDIMKKDVVRVREDTDQEEVARIVARYNMLAVPVVDENNVLLGIVTVDDVIDVIKEEAAEDMFKMAGATHAIETTTSLIKKAWLRLPWLIAPSLTGILASFVMALFTEQLKAAEYLAFFLPVVMGMAGNAGSQTAVITVRSIATGQLATSKFILFLLREIIVGFLLGLFYGMLVGSVAFWGHGQKFGMVVSLSMICSMTIAVILGFAVPHIFEKIHIDPAIATGPLVASTLDVTGVLIYFSMATFIMSV